MTHDSLYPVKFVKHVRIPMSDGIELDAHLWMPEGDGPFPAVFDYYPYRKDDLSAGALRYQKYLAQRGYVAARIDVRGTGSSGGVAVDEYTLQEQLDGVEAIAWLAAQPWCNGNVGMFGSSYGGFNSLQVAMHRPPALKAICPMYFTDNRYADECHYKGGALQMLYDVGTYGLAMVAMNALPPYPEATGPRWAETWADHLRAEPWLLNWLAHQTHDDYWRHGSLCEDYAAVQCAVLIIGGWRDGYTNCNLRTFEHLRCPKKALIGPWLHVVPDVGLPGPRLDHLHEMARFFDYWLKGEDNGVMDEPPIAVYMQRYDPPAAQRAVTSGEWRYETEWPLARGVEEVYLLDAGGTLTPADTAAPPREALRWDYPYRPDVGTSFGMFSAGSPLVLPGDQRPEEAYSLNWTTTPLTAPLEILGRPRADVTVAVTAPVATLVVRLSDVAPDGTSALVTKGVLNLTHRDSDSDPTPLTPGQPYTVEVLLDATAWRFEPGHALRVSISSADFPNAWPSPYPYTGTIFSGGDAPSTLTLPVVPARDEPLPAPTFLPPAVESLVQGSSEPPVWSVTHDHIAGTTAVRIRTASSTRVDDTITVEREADATALVHPASPDRAAIRSVSRLTLHRPAQTVDVTAHGRIESTVDALHVTIQLAITLDGAAYHHRQWTRSLPRRLL